MSQAGVIDVEQSHPQIPTSFVTNSGTAIPIGNVLEILGEIVAAHSIPLETTGSGNTVTIVTQYASASASSLGTNAGLSSFSSTYFNVDANGFVSLVASSVGSTFTVDAFTAPGTNPVVPNGSGNITITGAQVAAGTTINVIRTDSLAANTYTIQIQRSQAVASSTIGDNGVSHFNNAEFTVDGNGFVSLKGGTTAAIQTINSIGPDSSGNFGLIGTANQIAVTPGTNLDTLSLIGPYTPSTYASQGILYGNSTSSIQATASVNNGVLITSATGLPSLLTDGTTGQVLTATTGSPPSWVSPASSSISISGDTGGALTGNAFTFTGGTTGLTFAGSVLTETLGGILALANGGTNANLTASNGGIFYSTATAGAILAGTATANQVLLSGSNTAPTWGTIAAAGGITTVKGNDGTAETPDGSGVFNIETANSTVQFRGTANTETLDFARTTNLLLGSNGVIGTATNSAGVGTGALAALTNGTGNSAFGQGAGAAVNTGNENSFFGKSAGAAVNGGGQNLMCGKNAGSSLTSGSSNVILGQAAGSSYTAGESSNIIIGSGTTGTAAESHVIRIGTSGSGTNQQNKCFIAGIDGISVGSTAQIVTEVSGQLGSAVLTQGTGITITPTANVIMISASSSGFSWTDVTTATQTIAAENGYITDRGGGVTYTLPASGSLGDTFIIVGKSGIATITPLALQQLLIGSASGTVGITGTAVSTNAGDCIEFVCITSGSSTVWRAQSFVGNWTLS